MPKTHMYHESNFGITSFNKSVYKFTTISQCCCISNYARRKKKQDTVEVQIVLFERMETVVHWLLFHVI